MQANKILLYLYKYLKKWQEKYENNIKHKIKKSHRSNKQKYVCFQELSLLVNKLTKESEVDSNLGVAPTDNLIYLKGRASISITP